MYIRVKRFRRTDGIKTYYYVVEGVRQGREIRQRVVRYLGTVETIMEKLELADRVIRRQYKRIALRGGEDV